MTTAGDSAQRPRVPFKVHFWLTILASPLLRFFSGRRALVGLRKAIASEPEAMASELLCQLGKRIDPVFVWHIYNLLWSIPASAFENKWVTALSLPLSGVSGDTVHDRILQCRNVIMRSFGLSYLLPGSTDLRVHYSRLPQKRGRDVLDSEKTCTQDLLAEQESAVLAWMMTNRIPPDLVSQDKKAVADLVRKAADGGDSVAQFLLSSIYAQGQGVATDTVLANELLHKSAEAGCLIAQCTIGSALFAGDKQGKDLSVSRKWLHEAAGNGSALARRMLAVIDKK